ncbi:hypothetical protein FS837_000659 [Tulasnella sp. UAMH 9824]|nr:hypothetical protein FS837_000659 [Tulasnella sp. UAMH 9824]
MPEATQGQVDCTTLAALRGREGIVAATNIDLDFLSLSSSTTTHSLSQPFALVDSHDLEAVHQPPPPSTPQSKLDKKLEPSRLSPTLKKKLVPAATHQRSANPVKEASSMHQSKQNGADILRRQTIQNRTQQRSKPTESPILGRDGSTLSPQTSTLTATQRRREAQPPTGAFLADQPLTTATDQRPSEAVTTTGSEPTWSSKWARPTKEEPKPIGTVVSLRTGRAVWTRRRPLWANAALAFLLTPPTPAVSLRKGRAAWSPQQPASSTTSAEVTQPASLRTGRAVWSPQQALPDSFWANGSQWSYSKSNGSLTPPRASQTKDAKKLDRECRHFQLLGPLDRVFREHQKRLSRQE